MVAIGSLKAMYNNFFSQTNSREPFFWVSNFVFFLNILILIFKNYLTFQKQLIGRTIHFIENRLLNVKYPIEIKRRNRPIADRHHYKANENRTIMNYLTYSLFKDLLAER